MDNFKIIYRILKTLEKALDYPELDTDLLAPEVLGISRERWEALLLMLLDSGYIDGLAEVRAVGMRGVKLVNPHITLKGLEYLSENSLMRKTAALFRGALDILT